MEGVSGCEEKGRETMNGSNIDREGRNVCQERRKEAVEECERVKIRC